MNKPGKRILVHDTAGGEGTALLELDRLAGLEVHGYVKKGGKKGHVDIAVGHA